MMKFVHPNILYFLLLLILPIIIHLFNFRRYKRLYFSSLQFIRQVDRKTNATKTLRHYLILAARLLAFAFLIFAFAQPYFPADNATNMAKNSIPIYLDNSFSMSAKGTNGDLLNQAKQTVRQIVKSYPREQRYILVTNSLSGAEFRSISRSELEDQLHYIHLSPLSRKLANPLESLQKYIAEQKGSGAHHYYVVSDFQQRNLGKDNVQLDTNSFYSLLKTTPQIKTNIYIDSIWFKQPFHRVDVNNSLTIRIVNTGKEKRFNVEVNVTINGKNRQTLVDLEANNSTDVTLNYTDKTKGSKAGKISIQDKNLYFDNQYYFTYSVKNKMNVLLINGENSIPLPQLVYATDSYYHIDRMNNAQINTSQLGAANLIVLNGLQTISSGLQTQLRQLITEGVNVLIIPPVQFNKTAYNSFLNSEQLPLLNTTIDQSIRVGKIASKRPFFKGMFSKKTDNVRMPPLKKYLATTSYTSANFNTLIAYENGMPLLVNQAENKRVYVLYTPIDPGFNNFGKSALFSSVLLRIGEKSVDKNPLSLTIGSSDEFTVRTQDKNDLSLQLKKEKIAFIPALRQYNNFVQISVQKAINNEAIEDGIYTLSNNGTELGKIALNYNRNESDMKWANDGQIKDYMAAHHITNFSTENITNKADIQTIPLKKPNDLWRILLTLSLVFFLIEMSIVLFWKVK